VTKKKKEGDQERERAWVLSVKREEGKNAGVKKRPSTGTREIIQSWGGEKKGGG